MDRPDAARRRRTPFAVHELYGGDEEGVVRYDGDPDVFVALVWAWLIDNPEGRHRPIRPPTPGWWRCNPGSPDGTWALWGARPHQRGAFLGAVIELGAFPSHLCVDREEGERFPAHDWTLWRSRPGGGMQARYCNNCGGHEVRQLTHQPLEEACPAVY